MNRGRRREEIYRELTPIGIVVCMLAGAVAEGIIFQIFEIRSELVPTAVLFFLWGMFGFLSSGILLLADMSEEKLVQYRAARRDRKHRSGETRAVTVEHECPLSVIEALRAEFGDRMAEMIQSQPRPAHAAIVYDLYEVQEKHMQKKESVWMREKAS